MRGVAAAVSLFGDDLSCICFDHPNRETAMLSRREGREGVHYAEGPDFVISSIVCYIQRWFIIIQK